MVLLFVETKSIYLRQRSGFDSAGLDHSLFISPRNLRDVATGVAIAEL
jgi:hypothetical protein